MAGDGRTPGLLSIADIAKLAKVRPSAVSNWRVRKETFPRPAVDAPSGALFNFDEVEDWLLAEGKIPERLSRGDRLWPFYEQLRGQITQERAAELVRAGLVYLVACGRSGSGGLDIPSGAVWENVRKEVNVVFALGIAAREVQQRNEILDGLLEPLEDLASELGEAYARTFRDLLDSLQDTLGHGTDPAELFNELDVGSLRADRKLAEFTTPESQARLLASLIESHTTSVFDPALGTGLLLLEAAKAGSADRVVGWEIAESAVRVARSRLFVSGIDAEIDVRDSLNAAIYELPTADLVVIDPPFGLKSWGTPDTYRSDRWIFGEVSPRNGDFAWIQMASFLARPGGRGYVFSTPRTLSSGGSEGEIRRNLIDAGVVEAIVALPARLMLNTAMPTVLWIMRSPDTPRPEEPILLVDATDLGKSGKFQATLPKVAIERIAAVVSSWREDGRIDDRGEGIAIALDPSDISGGSLSPALYLAERHRSPEALRDRRDDVSDQLEALMPIEIGDLESSETVDLIAAPMYPLGDLAELRRWRAMKSRDRKQVSDEPGESLSRLIGAGDLRGRTPRFLPTSICEERLEEVRRDDVIFTVSDSGTKAAIVDDDLAGAYLDSQVWLVRPWNPERLAPEWIYTAIISEGFLTPALRGSTVQSVKKLEFENLELPLPPPEDQTRIGRLLLDLEERSAKAKSASDLLEELQTVLATQSIVSGRGDES